ncbi:MAG: 4Fe-4S dicluster domain-containing protein [Alphaproteobacteria bacterium]|nr:MAG: 4Fe-4S dicluster domain-containing protein [Alphaproteobacteria bacterium]
MARRNPHRPFRPDPAQMALAPPVSGNAVNGLGETAPRRARVVYWAPDPDRIPHGRMQRWFYQVDPDNPEIAAARADRAARVAIALPPVSGPPVQRSPEAWTAALQAFRTEAGVDMVGVAAMDPDWLYEGQKTHFSRVIMLAVRHDFDRIATAPAATAGAEVIVQYGRAMAGALRVATWLHRQGWEAEPQTGPMAGKILLIPPAIACGFGELGKHGSVINPEFGASFRLAAVLTDAPLAPTAPRSFGVDGFCQSCRLCEDACPPEAIAPRKQMVRGVEKWYVDFDRCLPFFNQHHGCAICIAVCPWSRPGVGPRLAAKLERRALRKG